MAVKELTDYLENGNIKNSVNFPSCDMGMCQAEKPVAVLHMNIPNMIGQITRNIGEQGMNISDMTNKSRDKYATPPIWKWCGDPLPNPPHRGVWGGGGGGWVNVGRKRWGQ